MTRHALLAATLLLPACTLPACTLIDQNTFNPQARNAPVLPKPPVVAAAPPLLGPPPLLVVPPGATGYDDTLRTAVAAARARKPGVLFDVVEMQPPDLAADAPLGQDAAAVARLIAQSGIPPANIRLAARPEAAVPPGQVRVYVH